MATDSSIALTNRALRTIKTELEFLMDSSFISPQQCSSILSQLPAQAQLQPPIEPATPSIEPQFSNSISKNEKHSYDALPNPAPAPAPPPAYVPGVQVLSLAVALYAYVPTDAGDLALEQNDQVQVTEHMNGDWWRGRNERTGLEGIFPRSYVNTIDEKGFSAMPASGTAYGNLPLDVSQPGSSVVQAESKRPSKFEENGKKFGKKMGNAAIFGAGATIGSNIVRGVF